MRAQGRKFWCQNETPNFPRSKFDFLQWLSHFREIQENLLQWLSEFFNGFPLSETAFRFLQRLRFPRNLLQRLCFLRNLLQWLSNFFNGFPITKFSNFENYAFELIAIHHTVLQVIKTCMLKWLFN